MHLKENRKKSSSQQTFDNRLIGDYLSQSWVPWIASVYPSVRSPPPQGSRVKFPGGRRRKSHRLQEAGVSSLKKEGD